MRRNAVRWFREEASECLCSLCSSPVVFLEGPAGLKVKVKVNPSYGLHSYTPPTPTTPLQRPSGQGSPCRWSWTGWRAGWGCSWRWGSSGSPAGWTGWLRTGWPWWGCGDSRGTVGLFIYLKTFWVHFYFLRDFSLLEDFRLGVKTIDLSSNIQRWRIPSKVRR